MIRYSVFDSCLCAAGKWPVSRDAALRESIRKWEFIAKNARQITECGSRHTCALCHRYGLYCNNCPVSIAGFYCCDDTPLLTFSFGSKPYQRKRAALAEVRFLRSLLKKPRKARKAGGSK